MSIETLKDQARRHEQKEEWKKALDLYRQAITKLDQDDQPDIGLYNRVGDLQTRIGNIEAAVEHYERAVDLYIETDLPNNAIAVCKKIIRNMPLRNTVYLRMGQIRAEQGFYVDAKQNFLKYAERVQAAGDTDEALRALTEFSELFPEDVEIRIAVSRQLEQHERGDEALNLLRAGYHTLAVGRGDPDLAAPLAERIHEIDPSVDLSAPPEDLGFEATSFGTGDDLEEDFSYGMDEEVEAAEPLPGLDDMPPAESVPDSLPSLDDADSFGVEDVEPDPETADLMTFSSSFRSSSDGEDMDDVPEDGSPLPGFDDGDVLGEADDLGGIGPDLADAAEDRRADERAAPGGAAESLLQSGTEAVRSGDRSGGVSRLVGAYDAALASGDLALARRAAEALLSAEPDEVAHRQRLVELAFRGSDVEAQIESYLGLAAALERSGEKERADSVYQQVLALAPGNATARAALGRKTEPPAETGVASSDDYVDLGSMILDDEPDEKTTRFKVAYEEPSGDEDADFAKMLSQFKEKVAENVEASDVTAHHDLGTAYKEMGLLDEAIQEFQAALRANPRHLPTFELLGQCFMDRGDEEAAVRALSRALDQPFEVEDEMLGIYYYLGRAHEQLGNTESAVEFYDRVFSLDINFADVTERLRALR